MMSELTLKSPQKSKEESIANKTNIDFDPELEPLLKENPRRFVIFPIQYPDIWNMYKKVSVLSGEKF